MSRVAKSPTFLSRENSAPIRDIAPQQRTGGRILDLMLPHPTFANVASGWKIQDPML